MSPPADKDVLAAKLRSLATRLVQLEDPDGDLDYTSVEAFIDELEEEIQELEEETGVEAEEDDEDEEDDAA